MAERAPSAITRSHHHVGPPPSRPMPTRTMPYTPRLTMAADIKADTGPGASGWARGNQTCKGTAPAFDPKPTRASTKEVLRAQTGRCDDLTAMTAKDWLPERVASKTNPRINAAAPNCVITAYHWAATCTSLRRAWSVRTRKSDVTAMSSQRNKNVVTLDAAGTRSSVVTNNGRMHEAVRLERPWPVYPTRKTMAQIPTTAVMTTKRAPKR